MLKNLKSKLLSLFLVLAMLLFPAATHAQEIDTEKDKYVADVKKGEKAPYTGILMTHRLAAEIEQNCSEEVQESRCQIRVRKDVALCESKCKEQTGVLESQVLLASERHKKEIQAKDLRISALESKLPKWYESPKLWFAAGVFLGGATVVLAVRSANRISH